MGGVVVFRSFPQLFFCVVFRHPAKELTQYYAAGQRSLLCTARAPTYNGPELLSIKSSDNHEYLNNAIRVTLTVFAFRLYLMQTDHAVRAAAGSVSVVGMLAPVWACTRAGDLGLTGSIRIVAREHDCCLIVCRHQHTRS